MAALRRLAVLDTGPTTELDELVKVLSRMFGVASAAVSLVDTDRLWFKASIGIDFAQTPRAASFCDHTVRQDDVLVVEDAISDDRFATHPLVVGASRIRFYAGAPIRTYDGQAVGTLCVLGPRPRPVDPVEQDVLLLLAQRVGAILEAAAPVPLPEPRLPVDPAVHRSLVQLASLVTGPREAMATIEAVAETALGLLGAASVSISRVDEAGTVLVTLINVGDLGPGEQRWPTDERYTLTDYPSTMAVLDSDRHGAVMAHVDDPSSDPAEVALLHQLGKGSSINAPIVRDGVVWGEVYACRHVGEPRFNDDTAELSEVVAELIAASVAHAETWQQLHALASTDPMTGLANRRVFDGRLRDLLSVPVGVPGFALVLGDIDGLKQVNDSLGHPAGDEAIVAVAEAAGRAVVDVPGAVAARLGGDEFALLLPDVVDDEALAVAQAWSEACKDGFHGTSLSVGMVVIAGGSHQASAVFGRADRALYLAKQSHTREPVLRRL